MIVTIDTNTVKKVDFQSLITDMESVIATTSYYGDEFLDKKRNNLGLLIEALGPIIEKWSE